MRPTTAPEAPPAAAVRLLRDTCPRGTGGVARLDDGDLVEVYGRVAPAPEAEGFPAQVESILTGLHDLLAGQGLGLDDVVTERWFLADPARQYDTLRAAHAAAYGPDPPASTWLQQPACAAGRLAELQVYALRSLSGAHRVEAVGGLGGPGRPRLVTGPDVTHLHLRNLTAGPALAAAAFGPQCHDLFATMRRVLDTWHLTPESLVRTWIYLRDMEADYHELNAVRSACFDDWGVTRLPASTGIGGGTWPSGQRVCADALFVWGQGVDRIDTMHAPTLGEATQYGSAFSRGLRLQRRGRTVLYVSGTASIDTAGRVVHVGDIEGQCHRMLDNVEALLAAQGACLGHTVSAVTYLKNRAFLPVFDAVCRRRGVPEDLLNSVVVAEVCRPEWLCEMELTAVLPVGSPGA